MNEGLLRQLLKLTRHLDAIIVKQANEDGGLKGYGINIEVAGLSYELERELTLTILQRRLELEPQGLCRAQCACGTRLLSVAARKPDEVKHAFSRDEERAVENEALSRAILNSLGTINGLDVGKVLVVVVHADEAKGTAQ